MKFCWQEYSIGSVTVVPLKVVPFSLPAYNLPALVSALRNGVELLGVEPVSLLYQLLFCVEEKGDKFKKLVVL